MLNQQQTIAFDPKNYKYFRQVQPLQIGTATSTSPANTYSTGKIKLDQDYNTILGLAIYDLSPDFNQSALGFDIKLSAGQGEIIQDFSNRLNWIFASSFGGYSQMPENEHYKLLNYDISGSHQAEIEVKVLSEMVNKYIKLDCVFLLAKAR